MKIYELSDVQPVEPIGIFTTEPGSGSETIRIDTEDEHYIVNWHTKKFDLDESIHYRITVFVNDTELGYADVDVVGSGKNQQEVETESYIPLKYGRTLPIKFRIEAGALNNPPVARFTANPESGSAPLTVSFDASASSDPDAGDTLSYSWDFGDGTSDTGVALCHTYNLKGSYVVTLTVHDSIGSTDTANTTITVTAQIPVAVAAKWYRSFAVLSDGTVMAWGRNNYGQLGDGTRIDRNIPVTVSGITNAESIAVGCYHTVALLSDGTVKAWGNNSSGQLGDGTKIQSSTPVTVKGITNAVAVAAGQDHSLALLSDGTIKAWGWNYLCQLGASTTPYVFSNIPVTVDSIINAVSVAAGWYHSLAILSDGTVKAWGYNNKGQLGSTSMKIDPESTDPVLFQRPATPVSVDGINNAMDIAAGAYHSVAVLSNGAVKSWGQNDEGQLGDGTDVSLSKIPVTVVGIDTAIAVAADMSHTVALLSDGTLNVWGLFYQGPSRNTPEKVSGINNVMAVATGGGHIVALLSDGTVKALGTNSSGQLGDGTNTGGLTPVLVGGL